MKEIECVSYWLGERGRVDKVLVNYTDNDSKCFPGDLFRAGELPEDVKKFAGEAHKCNQMKLKTGRVINTLYN